MAPRQTDKHGLLWRATVRPTLRLLNVCADLVFLPLAPLVAVLSRLRSRPADIGLGPEPLVNNVYHKRALERFGYVVETFVDQVWHITSDFDYRGDLVFRGLLRPFRSYALFCRALFRYRCLYIYFNGGPLFGRPVLWRLEPLLYRLAGIKVIVMPYGGDVQVMSRSRNLAFKHAMAMDYPDFRLRAKRTADQVDLWTRWADHVFSGVEWVDYMYHWDTLMLGHFSIDTEQWDCVQTPRRPGPVRVLHAPNHAAIKGTEHFIRAIEELRAEGVDVELQILQGVPNEQIKDAIGDADIIADQLIVGWYAMFALEGMALRKPVLCFLREDLLSLYEATSLLGPGEMPIVNCGPFTVKEAIRRLVGDAAERERLGVAGREFILAHHSLEYVGSVFDAVNRACGIVPRAASENGQTSCAV